MKKLLLILCAASLTAQTTGEEAVNSAEIAQSNNWQNWTFAAVAIVVAAGAVYFVSLDDGHAAITQ